MQNSNEIEELLDELEDDYDLNIFDVGEVLLDEEKEDFDDYLDEDFTEFEEGDNDTPSVEPLDYDFSKDDENQVCSAYA